MTVRVEELRAIWAGYLARERWDGAVYLVMAVVGAVVGAVFDPSAFVLVGPFIAVMLAIWVFYWFRAKRRDRGNDGDSSLLRPAKLSCLSTSRLALASGFNGRAATSRSEPEGELAFRLDGIRWVPGEFSSKRGSRSFAIDYSAVEFASLFHSRSEGALFVVCGNEITVFTVRRASLARLESAVIRSGLALTP